ncbi:MAG: hypothetical protein U0229_24785 [Anaeromyxobacter sp.]
MTRQIESPFVGGLDVLEFGAAADGMRDDTDAWSAALAEAARRNLPVEGGNRSYRVLRSVRLLPGSVVRNARFIAGTPGMNVILVDSGARLTGVRITGTGTRGLTERGIYPASDGASDVVLDVTVDHLTIGVQAQPLLESMPARWRGKILAEDIVGNVGVSEGYGVLLSPAKGFQLEVTARRVARHALYLSAGASQNEINLLVEGCGNAAVQLYSTPDQPPTRDNVVRGKISGVFVPPGQAPGQSVGVYVLANARNNEISVEMDGGGRAEYAIVLEGSGVPGQPLPTANRVVGCRIQGRFLGTDVIKDLNGDGTLITANTIRASASRTVLGLRRTGSPTPLAGPSVHDNDVDAQGTDVDGIYDEVVAATSYVGTNRIRNNGRGTRIRDATDGRRTGWSREYNGSAVIECPRANEACSTTVSWPETIASPWVSASATGFSASSEGFFPAYASAVTAEGANIVVFNGSNVPQSITVDYTLRGD